MSDSGFAAAARKISSAIVRRGGGNPKCRQHLFVTMRPRAVRIRKPCWIRNGSSTSSIVPRSSLSAAASDLDADRAAVEVLDDRGHQAAVVRVETFRVDLEHLQRGAGDGGGDDAAGLDLGVVAHAAQQTVGDARRAAGALGDLAGAFRLARDAEDLGGAAHDRGELERAVELQPLHDAEAVRAAARSGGPARVVAPISVNGGRSSLIERAAGPSPIMMSIWKSSSAG